jgi:hypothetical protein
MREKRVSAVFPFLICCSIMSFAGFSVEEALGWGAAPGPAEGIDLVSQAIKKEKLIKCVSFSSRFLTLSI